MAYSSFTGETENAVSITVQINLGSDDAYAAQDMAVWCYTIARDTVEECGGDFIMCTATIVNKGAPVGMYATTDGKTYTVIQNGKMSEIELP